METPASSLPLSPVLALLSMCTLAYLVSGSSHALSCVVRKVRLTLTGITHMLLSKDKKWKKGSDPGKVVALPSTSPKTIIFIRHGESEWNEVFNRGFGPSFVIRLVKAVFKELTMLPTRDSVFFDSPLSEVGIRQAQEMIRFLQKPVLDDPDMEELVGQLRGLGTRKSVLTTSNLRRAIATGVIALWDRLQRSKEKFLVLSCLQEVTFNVDGMSLLEHGEVPDSALGLELGGEVPFDSLHNNGTKSLSSNGLTRMNDFCDWCFARDEEVVIVCGHSLYFRGFFQTFLPHASNHVSKKKKMVNCGVVAFSLVKGSAPGLSGYKIDPDSVKTVYGGFK